MPVQTAPQPVALTEDRRLDSDALLAFEDNLPALPATMGKLLRLIEDPNAGIEEIAVLVSGDASLTTQCLKLANSALFSRSREINEVTQALKVIGLNHLKTILFTGSIVRLQEDNLEAREYLRDNSVGTGVAMLMIAERLHRRDSDLLFLHAILHRLGQFIFLCHPLTKDRYAEVLELVRTERITYSEAERRRFGVAHTWLGGMLARRWNFHLDFIYVLLRNETDEAGPDPDLGEICTLVRLADQFAMASGKGTPPGYPVDETALIERAREKGVFFGNVKRAYQEFLRELDDKWSAARSVWPA